MLFDPRLTGHARRAQAADALIAATVEMADTPRPLMRRVVPDDGLHIWDHYPPDDAIDRTTKSRWFYHAHPPEERREGEHGHFHIFLDRKTFAGIAPVAGPLSPKKSDARVVHIAALTIDLAGLPTGLFTVNRWVTDEWLFDADAILDRLPRFDLSKANGDRLVSRWLTAAVATFAPEIEQILRARDVAIKDEPPSFFEDRSAEILSSVDLDLQRCVTQLDR
ncbi:hypothetical protein [Sphingomonas sp.]|uniref:DUF6969 family protein n=1 Tax=Sphingomonas sp. TaxID=28214 RepID=UPI0025CE3068|nr:hypothetical protein [Sphingomonas sp.]